MPFTIVRNNITDMSVDAIVNTANPLPVIGDGTDSAVHKKDGPQLLEERKRIGNIAVGQAVITPAFNLDAKYVIHTTGPVWAGGNRNEETLLESCYTNSLALAKANGCKSVAFPLISTGAYGFPKGLGLQIATKAISQFVLTNDMMVYLVVFDKASYSLSEKLFNEIESYIDDNYVGRRIKEEYRNSMLRGRAVRSERPVLKNKPLYSRAETPFEDYEDDEMPVLSATAFADTDWNDMADNLGKTFSETLLELIEQKGMTHSQAYNKANIDKKHFHKIKNNRNYNPTKYTVLAFAIALELDITQTKALMETAGLALSKSNLFDVIVSFFIENRRYNVFELNDVLFEYDLPLLGC